MEKNIIKYYKMIKRFNNIFKTKETKEEKERQEKERQEKERQEKERQERERQEREKEEEENGIIYDEFIFNKKITQEENENDINNIILYNIDKNDIIKLINLIKILMNDVNILYIKPKLNNYTFIDNFNILLNYIIKCENTNNEIERKINLIFLLQYYDYILNAIIKLLNTPNNIENNYNNYLLSLSIKLNILLKKLIDYYNDKKYFNIKFGETYQDITIKLFNKINEDLDYNNKKKINILIKFYILHIEQNINMFKHLLTGGANKYKKTENKITIIYNKKKYTRVIYLCERKKYIKLNKMFMLLSKLKKV